MKSVVTFIGTFFIASTTFASGIGYSSKQAYVDDWYSTAVNQMIEYKIPASITLAQGILESGYGNSSLAKNANNHFGIKCHDWTGARIYHDDDKKNECFRKYTSAAESYKDHSLFLTGKQRYAKLFELDIYDYKAWAKELKNAGYATNSKYPALLISIIEDLKLYKYDKLGVQDIKKANTSKIAKASTAKSTVAKKSKKEKDITIEVDYTNKQSKVFSPLKRSERLVLSQPNKVKYIIAQKGDTFYKIAEEFELTLAQLRRYNDFKDGKDFLEVGDIIYVQPKRKAAKSQKTVSLSNDMSVLEISQAYGVKTSEIVKKNKLSSKKDILTKGKKVKL